MKNSCRITFEGLNVNRLLCQLCKIGTTVFSFERSGKRCVVEVSATRAKQTIALLQEKCYNIIDIEYVGATAALKFIQKRFLLPIICIVCLLFIAISSSFCFKIEISGDFDNDEVRQSLQNAGVRIGSNLSTIDVDVLENTLANDLGAMYAVVTRSGSVLYVNAVAPKQIDPPIDMAKRRDIVATRSGIVTNILCEQGTALVKVGDYVNAGDVLIEGKRIYNDGTSDEVYALGKVTLQISVSGFAEYKGFKTETVETGNVFTCTGVVLFGKEYGKTCPFVNYTLDTVVTWLYPLNVQICNNVYRETQTVTVAATLEECLDELQQQAYQLALANCDFTVIDTQYTNNSDGVTATLYGEVHIE